VKIPSAHLNLASKINPFRLKREGPVFCLLSVLLLLCLLITPAAAKSDDWKMTPTDLRVGDTLKITGTASPDAGVPFSVSHDMKLPVLNGRYKLELNNLPVPEWNKNLFTVRAEGVKNLKISDEVSILGIPYSLHLDVNANRGGIATVVQRDPPFLDKLFYNNNIVIEGDALKGKSSVQLEVKVDETLTADSNGKFALDYDTSALPPGEYVLKIGNKARAVELKPKLKPPHADFTAVAAGGRTPFKVQFIDESSGVITSRSWDFNNDGIPDSSAKNPVYSYQKAGTYKVTLTVGNSAGTSTKTHYVTVKLHGR
jgi:PKD domain